MKHEPQSRTASVLVVDDEPNYLVILAELLGDEGYEVFTAASAEAALEIAASTDLDLVITDMRMPGMDGMELLERLQGQGPAPPPVIMITAFGEVEMAVQAMRAGAFNYLTKPFNNDELLASVRRAVEHHDVVRENQRLRSEMRERLGFADIIGKNPAMQQVYDLIEKVAPTDSSVLITGESGTGKELVARAIHLASRRKDGPFISVNCAALPETLLESELFGHERGAFTGAVAMRKGRFELADHGTLFLDEIGDLPLPLQAKLLRVLQEHQFERVGGSRTLTVDVRIVTATNRDLKDEVEAGRFREDLYYRLDVVHIHLPPLRERTDDIPMLVAHFLRRQRQRLGRPQLDITTEALRFLTTLPWEGNIRELENTIERAAILAGGDQITLDDVQPETAPTPPSDWAAGLDLEQLVPTGVPLPEALDTIEKKLIERALDRAGGVQAHAAEELGITKSLLQYKMKKFGLHRPKAGAAR